MRRSPQPKKEGKVAVVGSPDPVMRSEVIPAFSVTASR